MIMTLAYRLGINDCWGGVDDIAIYDDNTSDRPDFNYIDISIPHQQRLPD